MVDTLFMTSIVIWSILGLALLVTVVRRIVARPDRVRAEARDTAARVAWITQLKEDQP
jgi:hypothetical protein